MDAKEYEALAVKMSNDTEFAEAVKKIKNEAELYEVYKKFGYTDMEQAEFAKVIRERIHKTAQYVKERYEERTELNEEELDNVVGGFDLLKFFKGILDFIPGMGPVLSSWIDAGISFAKGNVEEGFKELGLGVAKGAISAGLGFGGKVITFGLSSIAAGMSNSAINRATDSTAHTGNEFVDSFLS